MTVAERPLLTNLDCSLLLLLHALLGSPPSHCVKLQQIMLCQHTAECMKADPYIGHSIATCCPIG